MPNWIGGPEMLIALVVILLLFGAKRIPELARGLGSGVREFKAGTKEGAVEKDEKKKDEELPAGEEKAEEVEARESAEKKDTKTEEDASVEADRAEQKQH